MKLRSYIFQTLCIAVIAITGCTKDNYKPPTSTLSGRVVYQGVALGVRSNGATTGGAQLELWQRGYAFFTKIPIYVAYDGSYSALLFDGDYLLTRATGAPWVTQTDSIKVHVAGNTQLDVPVTPYYLVNSATYAKGVGNITATINVTKVNPTSTLEAVRLYVFKTILVDQAQNDANTSIVGSTVTPGTPFTATVTIPANLATASSVYVRVGVKTTGVAELAYSPPVLVNLN
jgi:hypothetical protein